MNAARDLIETEIAAAPDTEQDHMSAHLVRHLQSYALLPKGPGRLLDIGGPSLYSLPLSRLKDWQIETVEILAIDYERDPLPRPGDSMDAVTLCEVIEHFTFDPLFCLAEVNRVLRPGGVLLVSTPNAASWFAIYQALQHRPSNRWPVYATPDAPNRENHIHAREYLVDDLETLLTAAGFKSETILTRDYGILPSYVPIPGFPEDHRGETIFCLARKAGPPRLRCVRPVYLEDRPWPAGEEAL
ncbi:class I SAM-dependent methyltransferase [Palleronia abyssalis]|nr:methyltransferase domain-containing protein [Palleronia abyssalis]